MAVNTTNSSALAMMNQYKLNLAANKDAAQDLNPAPDEAGDNADYQVRISEQAMQLARQEKIRTAYDMTPAVGQETDAALNHSRFEVSTRNRAEAMQLAEQTRGATRHGLEVVA